METKNHLKPTTDLCDQHPDKIKVVEPLSWKDYGQKSMFAGQVETVKCFEDNSKVKELLGTEGKGKVLVVDGGGSMRRALLGDNLANMAVKNGWSGIVIFGCIRDSAEIQEIDLGVKALGTHPMKTEKRQLGDIGVAVTFGGVTFQKGDYLYADQDGIIISETPLL